MSGSILVVDDEQDFLESVRRALVSSGFRNVRLEKNPLEAMSALEKGATFDLALIDIHMPEMDGMELLEKLRAESPETECMMVTAVNEARVAIECLRKGAYDYLTKPLSRDDLIAAVRRGLEKKRFLEILALHKTEHSPKLLNKEAFRPIVTQSGKIEKILEEAELHAESDVPILITGESGTGKELLAQAIHRASPRARYPFTPINMVSLPGSLFEAEFFGYTRGAFTGADKERPGYLEHTNRGTLFLDEIGDLPLDFQGKLLRVLQEGEYYRLGTNHPLKVDLRIIAATNMDLDRQISKGAFRKDLYYRLKGALLHLPPLKERKEDILLLAMNILKEIPRGKGLTVDEEALGLLIDYDYPGNVRELKSILQSAANLAKDGILDIKSLPPTFVQRRRSTSTGKSMKGQEAILPLGEIEKAHILKIYDQTNKNKTQTADLLKIGLNTLRRKLDSYGVD